MPDVLVLSVAHSLGDSRLHRLCTALVDEGLDTEVRALGPRSMAPDGVGCRPWRASNFARRGVRALIAPLVRRCDVLVVIDPDLIPGALLARRLRRVRAVVCDVHEDYEQVVADREWTTPWLRRAALLVARLGRRTAESADWTIVADTHLRPFAARRRRVVRNVPVRLPASPVRTTPRAVYVGDVRASRGVFEMVEGVLQTPNWELDIIGPINSAAESSRLHELIGDQERVRLLGRLTPTQSWEVAAGASVGLCMLSDTPAFRNAMPSKVYEYLNHGMAVVTSSLRRPAALVLDNGMGAVADSADSLCQQLRLWSERPDELAACQAAALTWSRQSLPDADEFAEVACEIAADVRGCRAPSSVRTPSPSAG